jgi:Uma2 family endonuclease
MVFDAPRAAPEPPAVDDRLVAPETRYEIHDGELVFVSPADPPHGKRHSKVSALVEAHAGPAFDVASDMLTRTTEIDDFAPDVSVFPDAPDPVTGGRQVEELAFEVISTGTLGRAGGKAAKLIARGVRRVFAVDVERSRALEWSTALGTWSVLDVAAYIEDPVLAAPLPIDALVRDAKVDDAVARALLIKQNPVLEAVLAERVAAAVARGQEQALAEGKEQGLAEGKEQGLAEGKEQGLAEGKEQGLAEGKEQGLAEGLARGMAEAVIWVLDARGIILHSADRARILGERDPATLASWVARAATCAAVAGLFDVTVRHG